MEADRTIDLDPGLAGDGRSRQTIDLDDDKDAAIATASGESSAIPGASPASPKTPSSFAQPLRGVHAKCKLIDSEPAEAAGDKQKEAEGIKQKDKDTEGAGIKQKEDA